MSAKEELFQRLSEGNENAENVTVRTDESAGTIEVALDDTVAELTPDEAKSFSMTLEEDARDEGWYHTGQTKPLIKDIQESAEQVH